jgi:Putative Ig domain
MRRQNMTTLHLRKSIGRSLLLLLGFLAFPRLLAAFPDLTIPFPDEVQDGTIYHTDGNGHMIPPVYAVNPVTLLAWGGTPFSGYTWTRSTGSAFPAGTTVDPLTGIFHGDGSPLIAGGPYFFDMTVSDGSTTAHATFSFTVRDDYTNPPAVVIFEQLNLCCFPLPDARAGLGYGASLYADGGTPPYQSWSLAGGALPPGMSIDMDHGVVRGTPASSAAGNTYSFQVNVLDNTHTPAHNPFNLTYTIRVGSNDIFDGVPLGGGWFYSSWFGYYASISYPWIWHRELGPLYVFGTNSNSIWLYSPTLDDFLWTTSTTYPFLWSDRAQAWLWYQRGTSNPLWFYNFSLGQWVNGT